MRRLRGRAGRGGRLTDLKKITDVAIDLDRGLFVILLEDLQNREAETKCMSQVRGAERASGEGAED